MNLLFPKTTIESYPFIKAAGLPTPKAPSGAPKAPSGKSAVPSNAIPLGATERAPGSGAVITGPRGGRYYVPVAGEAVSAEMTARKKGTPEQIPGVKEEKIPTEIAAKVPTQVDAKEFITNNPDIPRPDLFRSDMPVGVSFLDLRDFYKQIKETKNMITQRLKGHPKQSEMLQ